MAGNYHLHLHTLPQVTPLLRVQGSLPGPVKITAGWFRARVRPWNDTITDPMLRIDRGGAEFLRSVSNELLDMGADAIYSPALYPDSTGIWSRSGFQPHADLAVMERSLLTPGRRSSVEVLETDHPDWRAVLDVDRMAFAGFWGMSALGLREAFDASRTSSLLETRIDTELVGYALVGSHWAVSYLHRIAVHPDHRGEGLGSALVGAAISWARAHGGRSMVLNVRKENRRAQTLYERSGFTNTGTMLTILRRRGMLD